MSSITRKEVVLPAPFGPSSPKSSPFSTLNETSSTALTGPKALVMWEMSTAGINYSMRYKIYYEIGLPIKSLNRGFHTVNAGKRIILPRYGTSHYSRRHSPGLQRAKWEANL